MQSTKYEKTKIIGFVGVVFVYPIVFISMICYNYLTNQNYIFLNLLTLDFSNIYVSLLIVSYGTIATVACLFCTIGMMYVENAIWVPIFDNCEIPILYLFEFYVLKYHSTNWITYLGSALIVLVVLCLSIQKYFTQNPNGNTHTHTRTQF